ncbi:MAG: hypothetical protein GX971_15290 [Firmicutes bacterium]|mgnify:CR=1 FL=1|nr:hypothetical protein [Bacillota bacterium]
MSLQDDLDRTQLVFLDTCRKLMELGSLTKEEYLEISDLIDRLDEYDNESFKAELRRISKGLSDLIS